MYLDMPRQNKNYCRSRDH